MTFNVNADCLRAAAICQSNEETRYYLRGVYIEPHAVAGVLLVATDGHRMVVIHDETGFCDKPVIVGLDKDALKATKKDKREREARRVVSDAEGEVWVNDCHGGKLTYVKDPIVDGTFPDWRRVLPGKSQSVANPDVSLQWFNADYLAAFGDVATALEGTSGRTFKGIRIEPGYNGGPALVRFGHRADAFGVIMSVRATNFDEGIPDFVYATPELAKAA